MERLLNQRGLYRKRARAIVKKAVSSKAMGHPKIVHNRSAEPLTWQKEEELMRIQEKKQREIDTFWGKDKDLHDRMIESKIMIVEDVRSYKLARWREQTVIFDAWDEVFRQKKLKEDRVKEGYREIERQEYIKYVNSSLTSDDIIDFVWDQNERKHADDNPRPKHADRWWRQSSSALLPPHQAAPSIQNEVSLSIPSTIGALRMSVHMDGMQQARVILNKANQSYKESLQLLQLDPSADNDDNGSDLMSVSSQPSQTMSFSSANTDFMNQSIDSSDTYLNMPPPKPPRVPIVDGHLEHKWDQELMLNLAFIESDIGNKGYLTLDELLEAVGSDSVTELLSYTVFGSYLKLRHWWFFEDMYRNRSNLFVTIEADAESDTPEQTIFCDGVTYADWMKCAEKSAFESRVPLRHIRMQEEHMDIATAGLYPSILADDELFTPPAGAPGNDYTTVPEREHRCARFIEEGDCVWALHRGGSVWLPAVIKAINIGALEINRDHDTTSYSKITYDLWYPLSQKELERSRALNTRRQLLVLPSHRLQSYYPPKKVDTEREACAYAFELIDFQGRGLLQLSRLVTCLLSAEFHRVVLTSAALSMIFAHGCYADNARPNNGVRTIDIPPLLPVFIDTFSSSPSPSSSSSLHRDISSSSSHHSITKVSSSISARDWISKTDFLDFCIAAVEVKKYTLTM